MAEFVRHSKHMKTSQLIRWSLIKDHHENMSNLLAKFGGQVYSHSVTKADEGMLN